MSLALAQLLCDLMPLQEDVVLPAAHAQQDFAQQRDVVPVLGIDRDLGGGAERDLVARHVVLDVDDEAEWPEESEKTA